MPHEVFETEEEMQIIAAYNDEGEIGDFGDWVSGAVKSIGRVAKKVIKSKLTKAVVGGVAIVFPPVGVPAAAALVAADRIVRTAEGSKGTPKQRAAVHRAIKRTVIEAKAGDPDAERAIEFMALAKRLRAAQAAAQKRAGGPSGPRVSGPIVTSRGRIVRGVWVRVG